MKAFRLSISIGCLQGLKSLQAPKKADYHKACCYGNNRFPAYSLHCRMGTGIGGISKPNLNLTVIRPPIEE